jgi:hypothetical protein
VDDLSIQRDVMVSYGAFFRRNRLLVLIVLMLLGVTPCASSGFFSWEYAGICAPNNNAPSDNVTSLAESLFNPLPPWMIDA